MLARVRYAIFENTCLSLLCDIAGLFYEDLQKEKIIANPIQEAENSVALVANQPWLVNRCCALDTAEMDGTLLKINFKSPTIRDLLCYDCHSDYISYHCISFCSG